MIHLWILVLLAVLAVWVGANVYEIFSKPRAPPTIGRWIPFMGVGFSFGKRPMAFVDEAKAKYGKTFTLVVPGQKMTFLLNTKHFDMFFNSTDSISFQDAIEPFTGRVFGISKDHLQAYHGSSMTVVKTTLSVARTEQVGRTLEAGLTTLSKEWGTSGIHEDFYESIRKLLFWASVGAAFGENFKELGHELYDEFSDFDDQFILGASGIPHAFLPTFSSRRKILLQKLKNYAIHHRTEGNLADEMAAMFPSVKDAPPFLLVSLWALQANSLPIAFWTLAHILVDPSIHARVCEEVDNVAKKDQITPEIAKKLKFVNQCLHEAMRLYPPGLYIRKAIKDIHLEDSDFIIPAGNNLVVSAFLTHRDPTLYPEPTKFIPERFTEENMKSRPRNTYLPFGSGHWMCAGKNFALMELTMTIGFLFQHFDMKTNQTQVPDIVEHKPYGAAQPMRDIPFKVEYKLRN